MSASPIQHVSDTAFMVATYRAMETERRDPLFRDPLADKLAGAYGRKIVTDLPRRAGFGQWFVAIRTRIIDAFIEAAARPRRRHRPQSGRRPRHAPLSHGPAADAALDRGRLPQNHRLEEHAALGSETPRCQLERIALDLADRPARQQLFARIAGASSQTLVLTEGVILYLTTDEAGSLADDLKAQAAFRYWIIDYLSPEARQWRARNERKMKMETCPVPLRARGLVWVLRAAWLAARRYSLHSGRGAHAQPAARAAIFRDALDEAERAVCGQAPP